MFLGKYLLDLGRGQQMARSSTKVFISYRREDSPYIASVINDRLQERFGADSVFFDVDAIPLGVDFRKRILSAVAQCDVLLPIIGDRWFGERTQDSRLDDPDDFVRIEIEAAFESRIPVIPVLIGTATMPTAESLPESLRSLTYQNAAEVRAGKDLNQHLERLVRGIEDTSNRAQREATTGQRRPIENGTEQQAQQSFETSQFMRVAYAGGTFFINYVAFSFISLIVSVLVTAAGAPPPDEMGVGLFLSAGVWIAGIAWSAKLALDAMKSGKLKFLK